MGRSTLILAAALVACSSSDPFVSASQPDAGPPCIAGSHTCLPGTRCVGDLCVATCTGGTDCGPGRYCGGPSFPLDVCAPSDAVTCTSFLQCPFPQDCYLGRCAAGEALGDGGSGPCTLGVARDNCAPDAVCTPVNANPTCVGLSPCGADGGCAQGAISVGCNVLADGGQIIPGKGRICLLEECASDTDCLTGTHCAHVVLGQTYGKCQYGNYLDRCLVDHPDCSAALSCLDAGVQADGGPLLGRCACPDGGAPASDGGGCG